jgi:hypothetical protein
MHPTANRNSDFANKTIRQFFYLEFEEGRALDLLLNLLTYISAAGRSEMGMVEMMLQQRYVRS